MAKSISTATVPIAAVNPEGTRPTFGSLLGRYYLQLVLILSIVAGIIFIPNFATSGNFATILQQASFPGLIACGMTLLIATGQFDLSVAGIVAIGGITAAKILPSTTILITVLAVLAVGVALGIVNGIVVTKMRIPAFIATLGTFNLYTAIAFIWANGQVLPINSDNWLGFTNATYFGIPLVVITFAVAAVVVYLVMRRTYFGRNARGTGSSEPAARMAGLLVDRTKIIAFAITGLLSGVAAIFLSGLFSSANPTMAAGIELNAITIAVVGGTSLRGGSGTLLGTFTAAIFVSLLDDALVLLQVDSYWQYIAVGGVLIAALIAGQMRRGAATEARGAL